MYFLRTTTKLLARSPQPYRLFSSKFKFIPDTQKDDEYMIEYRQISKLSRYQSEDEGEEVVKRKFDPEM